MPYVFTTESESKTLHPTNRTIRTEGTYEECMIALMQEVQKLEQSAHPFWATCNTKHVSDEYDQPDMEGTRKTLYHEAKCRIDIPSSTGFQNIEWILLVWDKNHYLEFNPV